MYTSVVLGSSFSLIVDKYGSTSYSTDLTSGPHNCEVLRDVRRETSSKYDIV